MKYKVDKELAPYFMLNHFLSDKDKQQPDYEQIVNLTHLAIKLSEFRRVLGRMDITSGFRGKVWNASKEVGGDVNSFHLKGMAADFERKNSKGVEDWGEWTPDTLFAVANQIGFGNIGVYLDSETKAIKWVHVDIGKPWGNTSDGWVMYSDTMACKIYWR